MIRLNNALIIFSFVLFLLLIQIANSTTQVSIEFFYWDPREDPDYCETCGSWVGIFNDYLGKNDTMNEIRISYSGRVLVEWKKYYIYPYGKRILSDDGIRATVDYTATTPNSIVIKDGKGNFTTFIGYGINETRVIEVIEAYLAGLEPPPSPPPMPLIAVLAGAFAFGFFETFSPCLIILLSFVLGYSIGETTRFREGFLKVTTFGIGFIFATVLVFLGSVGLIIAFSTSVFQNALTFIICVFAIIFGLDLLGLNFLKFLKIKVETKPIIQKLSRKYVFTYAGLMALGFLFYFLDPCIAPIFVIMLGTFQETLLVFLPLVLLVFCLGVIVPFIGIGIVAGSISKLARSAYRHRSKIRAVSGIILMTYAVYFISFYLMRLNTVTTLGIVMIAITIMIILTIMLSFRKRHSNDVSN